jgi:hypothetical protein
MHDFKLPRHEPGEPDYPSTNALDVLNLAYLLTGIHLHTHCLIDIEEYMRSNSSQMIMNATL